MLTVGLLGLLDFKHLLQK